VGVSFVLLTEFFTLLNLNSHVLISILYRLNYEFFRFALSIVWGGVVGELVDVLSGWQLAKHADRASIKIDLFLDLLSHSVQSLIFPLLL
jgi:hypothetical protein